jgi:hypothetical protein
MHNVVGECRKCVDHKRHPSGGEVEPKHRSDLRKLQVGDVVDVTIDTRVVPWVGTDIRPAPRHPAGAR